MHHLWGCEGRWLADLGVGAGPPFSVPAKKRGSLDVAWVLAYERRDDGADTASSGVAASLTMAAAEQPASKAVPRIVGGTLGGRARN